MATDTQITVKRNLQGDVYPFAQESPKQQPEQPRSGAAALKTFFVQHLIGPALIVACFPAVYGLWLGYSISTEWSEMILYSVCCGILGFITASLPSATIILWRTFKPAAMLTLGLWCLLLLLNAHALSSWVTNQKQPEVPSQRAVASANRRIDDLRSRVETERSRVPLWVLDDTSFCRDSYYTHEFDACSRLVSARAALASAESEKQQLLSQTPPPPPTEENKFKRVMLGMILLVVPGLLIALGILTIAAGYILVGEGLKPKEKKVSEPPKPIDLSSIPLKAVDNFSIWLETRVELDQHSKMSSRAAYDDYAWFCGMNGKLPMSESDFFSSLTQRVSKLFPEQVTKVKSTGTMTYRGLRLKFALALNSTSDSRNLLESDV